MVPGVVFSGVFGGLAGLAWSLGSGHGLLTAFLAYQMFGLFWVAAFITCSELWRRSTERL